MKSRLLKDNNGTYLFGINGKKLRYLIDDTEKKNVGKFKDNWTDKAIDYIELKYSSYYFEYHNNKRGRPSKNNTPKHLKRVKESKLRKKLKTAATYDTSDEETEKKYINMEEYFKPFSIGDRVKMIISPYATGEIVNFINDDKLIVIKDEFGNLTHCSKNSIQKKRGRKPKKKIVQACSDSEELLELLKYEGKIYLINEQNEVMTMGGDYIGDYIDDKII